jgi:phosphoribosyl 1,2-cyclic phosphodiesterase
MLVRFWGVRGGIPTPEPGKMRFGGNTSCISVELDDGTLLILDGGTGLRLLGNELVERRTAGELEGHIFFSHLHWDHIQGIPFFKPLFQPGNRLHFYGRRPVDTSLRAQLEGQQNFAYFPVDMSYMSAEKTFTELGEEQFVVGGAVVRCRALNHPGGCLGYRIEAGAASFVYCTDNEHTGEGPEAAIVDLAADADILVFDTNYTPEEYRAGRVGWGHSTWRQAIINARAARVRHLVLFHHDQDHDDAFMDGLEATARSEFEHCTAAREGMRIRLQERREPQDWGIELSWFEDGEEVLLAGPLAAAGWQRSLSGRGRLDGTPLRGLAPEQLRHGLRRLDAALRAPLLLTRLAEEQRACLVGLELRHIRLS